MSAPGRSRPSWVGLVATSVLPVALACWMVAVVVDRSPSQGDPAPWYLFGSIWALVGGACGWWYARSRFHLLLAVGGACSLAIGFVAFAGEEPAAPAPAAAAAIAAGTVLASSAAPPLPHRRIILVALTTAVWASLLTGIWAVAGGGFPALHFLNDREVLGLAQLSGILGHPNTLGGVTALALVLQTRAYLDLRGARTASRPIELGALAIGPVTSLIVLAWSASRGGLIAAAAGLVVLAIPVTGSTGRRLRPFVAMGIAALPFVTLVAANRGWSSFNGRDYAWEIAGQQIAAHPIAGSGAAFLSQEFWAGIDDEPWSPGHAHHLLLEPLGRGGVLAALIVVATLLLALLAATAAAPFDRTWALATGAVVAAVGGLEPVFGVPRVGATYLLAVIALSVLGSSVRIAQISALGRHLGSSTTEGPRRDLLSHS